MSYDDISGAADSHQRWELVEMSDSDLKLSDQTEGVKSGGGGESAQQRGGLSGQRNWLELLDDLTAEEGTEGELDRSFPFLIQLQAVLREVKYEGFRTSLLRGEIIRMENLEAVLRGLDELSAHVLPVWGGIG